ncbi:MAG: FG-GAP-like repeat-containing protein [Pirellulales bacterium]
MLTRYQMATLLLGLSIACYAVFTISRADAEPASQIAATSPNSSSSQTTTNGKMLSQPLQAVSDEPSKRLTLLSAERTGVDFVHRWAPPAYDYDFRTLLNGGGVCLGDYDGDGLADIYLTRQAGSNRLYRNLGDFRFQDVTEEAGLIHEFWGMGASFVDIDNDGDLDLYACAFQSANRLYINQGDGTFTEQAAAYGLNYNGASIMMAMADYDNDGLLDGYLLTNRRQPKNHAQFKQRVLAGMHTDGNKAYFDEDLKEFMGVIMRPNGKYIPIMTGQRDRLYHNRGQGRFEEISDSSGISGYDLGLSATWWDYDDDGLTDLYVANDYMGPDRLYRNQGDGSFRDVARKSLPHTPWSSMGADVADLNNDGHLDFMGSDMSSSSHYRSKVTMGDMENMNWFLEFPQPRQYMRNAVYINSGTGRFMEGAFLCELAKTDWTWAIKCVDFDDDGRVDVFATNGMTRDWENADLVAEADKLGGYHSPAGLQFWLDQPPQAERNHAYRNLGDLHFESVASEWGLDHQGVSFGAAVGDLDGDGDLDLVVNNLENPVSIYQNNLSSGHRLKIRLVGSVSNRWGIGATVRLKNSAGIQVRFLTLARGIMSADDPHVHFGLGKHTQIDQLTVRWPSGHVQTFTDLAADRLITITEPVGPVPERKTHTAGATLSAGATLFKRSSCLQQAQHQEEAYNDYERQPLLPHKLSQLGPGLAWGDLNLDGRDDLYLAGASGQSGEVYQNLGNGRFKKARKYLQDTAADLDIASEDMGVLMFDADADGDLDVYVVSGGVECEPQADSLRDRLYLNDGRGTLTKAPEGRLPDLRDSGSVVTAADFDRDGDLDLFVGGRVVPGEYPVSPHSRLLQNEQGTFTDVTAKLAPELEKTGLVTSALWSDADGDGWLDLLVTHEWGPVKLYLNKQGRLTDQTAAAGLADRTGWYQGIAGRDIDGDGDIDYVVTNAGLNTKYHPSPKDPARIYYGDFEETGQMHIVEAKLKGDKLLPVRGKSCSQNAMPFVANKFPKYHDFASALLADIYTPTCLDQALAVEANSLESGVLVNDGQGRFTFRVLPRIAQIAPSFGVVLTELNGDTHPDLYLVQNFFGPQRETGRMDGGLSLLLLGTDQGTFEPVWPDRSGLEVHQDAKSLTIADLNGDHWPDFVVGINDQPLQAFINQGLAVGQGTAGGRMLTVRLHGPTGNPTAIGARVTMTQAGDDSQTAEVSAGGGYLSQSSSTLSFGLPTDSQFQQIEVRWPDGSQSSHTTSDDRVEITISARSPN